VVASLPRGIRSDVCPATDMTEWSPLRSRSFVTLAPRPPSRCRPRGFAPPRRFPPPHGLRACCISLPVGVRLVSGSTDQNTHRKRQRCLDRPGPSPCRSSHPSKNSPHPQPYRITAAVAPLTLTCIRTLESMGDASITCSRRGSGPKTSTSSVESTSRLDARTEVRAGAVP